MSTCAQPTLPVTALQCDGCASHAADVDILNNAGLLGEGLEDGGTVVIDLHRKRELVPGGLLALP